MAVELIALRDVLNPRGDKLIKKGEQFIVSKVMGKHYVSLGHAKYYEPSPKITEKVEKAKPETKEQKFPDKETKAPKRKPGRPKKKKDENGDNKD